jgi:hypothetical protein
VEVLVLEGSGQRRTLHGVMAGTATKSDAKGCMECITVMCSSSLVFVNLADSANFSRVIAPFCADGEIRSSVSSIQDSSPERKW